MVKNQISPCGNCHTIQVLVQGTNKTKLFERLVNVQLVREFPFAVVVEAMTALFAGVGQVNISVL